LFYLTAQKYLHNNPIDTVFDYTEPHFV